MLRGRAGGDGAPFNLGEATRHARHRRAADRRARLWPHARPRRRAGARLAAILDALWQRADARAEVETDVLAPIAARLAAERAQARRRDRRDARRLLHAGARRGRRMSALAFADPRLRIAGRVPRHPATPWLRPATIVACGAGLAPPAPLCARRRGGAADARRFRDAAVDRARVRRGAKRSRPISKFHTGAPLAAAPDKAAFALVDADARRPRSRALRARDAPEYPDRSTTFVAAGRSARDAARACGSPGPASSGEARFARRAAARRTSVAQWTRQSRQPSRSASI